MVEQVAEDALGVEVLPVSSVTGEGLDAVRALLGPGRTGAMVGPSGRREVQPGERAGRRDPRRRRGRSGSDGRGRHTTTARELHLLPGGGLLVDTPGMRELGLYDDGDGVDTAYADVAAAGRRLPVPRLRAPRPSPGARSPPPSTTAGSTPPGYTAWRKLQAEAHRQLLRVDARARAAEKARLRLVPPRDPGAAQPTALSRRAR